MSDSDDVAINFVSRSILHTHEFSWVFLVDWIMILLLTVFVLFYFNQLLGFVMNQTFCRFVRYRYGVYLKIQSVQISLLGGRIIFRNIVYIGTSQAIRIARGSLNWRYWVVRRQRSAYLQQAQAEFRRHSALQLTVHGVEWFVFNREYAYETLAKQEVPTAELVNEFENWQQELSIVERKFTELLPLYIEAERVGIVIGNDDTESLLVISAPESASTIDMAPASNKFDRYMLSVEAKFHHPEVQLKNNPDYHVSSITPERQDRQTNNSESAWRRKLRRQADQNPEEPWMGLRMYSERSDEEKVSHHPPAQVKENRDDGDKAENRDQSERVGVRRRKRGVTFQDPIGYDDSVNEAGAETPSQDNSKEGPRYVAQLSALPAEYARVSQLLACDTLTMKFNIDVVGPAKPSDDYSSKRSSELESDEESRLERDPLFDIQLVLTNAKINYGPFAERQRQGFYSVFFPQQCHTAKPPAYTSTGTPCINGLRMHPQATANLKFLGESILVVPTREGSKDEEFSASFLRSLHNLEGKLQRTYGWFEIRASSDSFVDIIIPFVPTIRGYETKVNAFFRKPDVRSSVNHDTMMCAQSHSIAIRYSQPLVWNDAIIYTVNHNSNELEYYVLREHATLITDMSDDFAAGPPVPYELFCPSRYDICWEISKFSMFMNVNKDNIINKPTSLQENTFLIVRAPELRLVWEMPRELITSPTSTLNTTLEAPLVDLELSAPNWHTLHGFLDWQRMARVDNFKIVMQHSFSTLSAARRDGEGRTHPNLSRFVDTQILDVSGEQFAIVAHGFLIDYIMRIRENYFGHAYHFQTTEEFLRKHNTSAGEGPAETTRKELDSDSEIRVKVERGCFLIPTRLYTCKDCISLQFMQLNANCRFTNYYMDLQVEIAPLVGRLLHGLNPGTVHEEALRASFSNADLSISQIDIHAHRMFGLPPIEPTYVVRWDFDIGDITTDFPLNFALAADDAKMAFAHSFRDDENKPVLAPEVLFDVTFVSVNIASVEAIIRPSSQDIPNCHRKEAGPRFKVSTSTIKVRSDDLANDRYSSHKTVEIPFVGFKGYNADNDLVLDADTAIYMTGFMNRPHQRDFYEKQQQHIALHDSLFQRATFLLDPRFRSNKRRPDKNETAELLKPCIPLKWFDPPLTRDNMNFLDHQFLALDQRWDNSDDTSQNTSVASLASDSTRNESTESDDSADDQISVPKLARSARARSADPSPEVFPFATCTTSAERDRLKFMTTDFSLNPTQWHSNAPQLEVDDEAENKSATIQVMPVMVSFTPGLIALVETFESEPNVDFEAQLDLLQIRIVYSLMREERFKEILRWHVIAPTITIDFSEKIHDNTGVRVDIKDVDTMLRLTGDERGANVVVNSLTVSLRHDSHKIVDVTRMHAASILLSKFSLWWQESSQEDGTGSLHLESIDGSVDAENIEWSINYLGQLINAIIFSRNVRRVSLMQHAPKAMKGRAKPGYSKQERLMATFYALTMAGEKMGVEQDSYVLSRPSGAIQSQAHVRSKIGWRLVMRLRYLLQRLPASETNALQKQIADGSFDLPDDAKEQTISIYRRWRSWEQSKNLEDTEIFKYVFDDKTFQQYVLSLSTKFLVSIESMVARVVYANRHEHFAGLDALRMQLVSTQVNDMQSLNLTFRCSKARARGSMELLTVATSVILALAKLDEQQRAQKVAFKNTAPFMEQKVDSKSPVQPAKSRALQACVSVFLLDLILEFDLLSLRVESQNHQVQFTSAVELMESEQVTSLFHSGTLVTTDGAFRLHQHGTRSGSLQSDQVDIFDALVQNVQMGYASRGVGPQANTWVTVNVQNLSVATHPTALQLAEILVLFIETDLPQIEEAVKVLQNAIIDQRSTSASARGVIPPIAPQNLNEISPNNLQHSHPALAQKLYENRESHVHSLASNTDSHGTSDLTKITIGHYVDFKIGAIKLRSKLVEDLRFVFQGKELAVKLRHTDALITSVNMNRCTLGLHFEEGSAAVANTQIEGFRSVLRYDSDLRALAIFNNADAIRLETISLVWILEYAKNRHLDDHVAQLLNQLDKAFALLDQSSSQGDSTSLLRGDSDSSIHSVDTAFYSVDPQVSLTRSIPRLRLRLVNGVREISVRLPLDTSSFRLIVAGAKLNFENFETFQELEGSTKTPDTMGAGINDLVLELHMSRKPTREIIRLKFNTSLHKENGKTLFNINSDYLKFALDPESVGALFIAVERLKQHSKDIFPSRGGATTSSTDDNAPGPESGARAKSADENFSSWRNIRVKMLLQSLTFSWFTSPESKEGVVLGFDKLQIRVAKLVAQLELLGVYLTPATNLTSPMKDRMNTAYLPYISAHAFVSKDGDEPSWIQGDMSGESVTLTFTPSVALWLLDLNESFAKTRSTIERLAHLARGDKPWPSTAGNAMDRNHGANELVSIPFNLRLNVHFDRGVLRLMEEKSRSTEAALELFSPSLDVALEFKKNQLLMRIDASPTANKVFPKAIPELKAMTTMIGRSINKHTEKYYTSDEPQTPTGSQPTSPVIPSSRTFGSRVSNFDDQIPFVGKLEYDIQVHLGSQELYLSCLPYGKVGAMLSTQGFDLLLTSPRSTQKVPTYLTIYGVLRKTTVSLQHMYSREVSCLIEFSKLVALVMHRQNDSYKIGVNLANPNIRLDLSKLHDMRVFYDIWSLFEMSSSGEQDGDLDQFDEEPQATRIRRKYSVSTSTKPKLSISPVAPSGPDFGTDDHNDASSATTSTSSGSVRRLSDAEAHKARRDSDGQRKRTDSHTNEPRLLKKYRRAVSSFPFAILINFTVSDLSVLLGMGPAIGQARVQIDRSWLVAMHSFSISQMLNAGIDSIHVHFMGRVGGTIKFEGFMAKMAVQWKETQDYPLVHIKTRMRKTGFYFSLDFHPFVAGSLNDLALVLTTQDQTHGEVDRVHVALTCTSVSLVLTALVLAHSFDVISLFKRLQSQISSLPIFMPEVAQEAATRSEQRRLRRQQKMLKYLSNGSGGIRVLIDVHMGQLLVHAFPTEFVDNTALKMFARRVEIHFDRRRMKENYETGLDLALDKCVVGLVGTKGGGYDKDLTDLDYEGFLNFVSASTMSSTIINTPEVTILMSTWESLKDVSTVQYTFSNDVHGSIEVGWNIGSINFIKEMINAHQDAWAVRQDVHEASIVSTETGSTTSAAQAYRDATASLKRSGTLQRVGNPRSTEHSLKGEFEKDTRPSKNTPGIDKANSNVMVLMGIRYIAREPPTILIPQLRDLGDATPPIEWLGVNRERLPLFIHYIFTRKLCMGAGEIEQVYSQLMGMLD